jgi:NAD(P)-dependent dehydrogenase (short-subunit alcohol dehydrogenase family)
VGLTASGGQSFTRASAAVPGLAEEGDRFGGAMFGPDRSSDVGPANLAGSDLLETTYGHGPAILLQLRRHQRAAQGAATQGGIKVPGPDDPVGGAAADHETDDEEVTTFEDAVEEEDGSAPATETLPDEEKFAIDALVNEAVISNKDRGPDEQLPTSELEVN